MYRDVASVHDENRTSSDDDEEADDRTDRYVGETSEMFKSKSLNKLKPFYNGSSLDDRVVEIRKSIYYIRLNWWEFDNFLKKLKNFLSETGKMNIKDEVTKQLVERLLSKKRDWLKREDVGKRDVTYEAIQLYTSQEGYAAIYSLSNRIFRKEDSIASVDLIRSVVFLVELINIDLYNYCIVFPEKKNFEGVVYRGLRVTAEEMKAFRSLRSCPIGERNIGVPLGLFSSSSDENVAKKFIKKQIHLQRSDDKPMTPLLMKIHVIGLKQEYIDHYTKMFPSSVLTTICAVDIRNLSRHRAEREVLLRGSFLHILDILHEDKCLGDKPCDVLEAVMLNDNRDHISTPFLGDQDDRARDLFGCMVTVTRSEFALKYCKENGLLEDAREYSKLLTANEVKLKGLMD